MTSFQERHPGLKGQRRVDNLGEDVGPHRHEIVYGTKGWYAEESIDATQLDKEIVREAIEIASVEAAMLFTECLTKDVTGLTPNEIMDGYGSQQDLHSCFVKCLKKRLGL